MLDRLIRPAPPYVVEDYDDGDPYSCMAAGRAEWDFRQGWMRRVEKCFGAPPEQLQELLSEHRDHTKGALFDVWMEIRREGPGNELSAWAAARLAELGYRHLVEYDKKDP